MRKHKKIRVKTEKTNRSLRHSIKQNDSNCVLKVTKNYCHHSIWVRSRIRKNRRPGVPQSLARSNHTFGELQITKNAIVTAATVAVRPPSGTTAETSEFQHSHEEIYDVHNPNTIWLTDCLQHIRKPRHIHKPRISISNGFRITSDHIHVRDLSLVGSRANWVPRTAVAQTCSDCSS